MSFQPALSKFIAFQDADECRRVRAIPKDQVCARSPHHHDEFAIRLVPDITAFYNEFGLDIVSRIVKAAKVGENCVLILPVGPVPQYDVAANIINRLNVDCKHLITFNMDEYADENGQTAPPDWEGSFATSMMASFFGKIRDDLRPLPHNIHFPNTKNIGRYSDMIAELGGADCCYGGIGWCGHIAFFESHLGDQYATLDEYKQAKAQIVELNPMTIMQNALHSFSGDWSWVPPKAASIGIADILGAKDRSFWLDGMCGPYTNMSWQRFIARLACQVYPNKHVPGSMLQLAKGSYNVYAPVADNCIIDMS